MEQLEYEEYEEYEEGRVQESVRVQENGCRRKEKFKESIESICCINQPTNNGE